MENRPMPRPEKPAAPLDAPDRTLASASPASPSDEDAAAFLLNEEEARPSKSREDEATRHTAAQEESQPAATEEPADEAANVKDTQPISAQSAAEQAAAEMKKAGAAHKTAML